MVRDEVDGQVEERGKPECKGLNDKVSHEDDLCCRVSGDDVAPVDL